MQLENMLQGTPLTVELLEKEIREAKDTQYLNKNSSRQQATEF
jgi:hypothetical protein